MRKLGFVVMLVSAAGGVTACGGSEKPKPVTTTVATQPADAFAKKAADVQPADTDIVKGGGIETPKPRFTLVLGEGKGGFKFRSKTLSDEAKAKIDAMFANDGEVKIDFTDARFEIEGYTDNLGSKDVNKQYGLARAKAVKAYLDEKYEIPEDRIKVVSFGMDMPVGDNATPEGRAQNRRVVIKVVD